MHVTVEIKWIGKHVSAAMYNMHTYSRRTVGYSDCCTVHVGTIKQISKHVSTAIYICTLQ
jgi:hypothetical protein